jgi:Domain found in Dishevelled, Egl-10, and Pleckstrin (DEP)
MKKLVLLAQEQTTHALLRSIAGVAGVDLIVTASLNQTIDTLTMSANEGCLVVLGLDALIESQRGAARAITKVREKLPSATIVLHAERKWLIDSYDSAWAQMCGADAIVAKISATRWQHTGENLLRLIEPDESAFARIRQRSMPYLRAAQQLEARNEPLKLVAAIEALGIDLASVARRMGRSGGVDIRDRSYHLRSYPECFVDSEAADWLGKAFGVSGADAVQIGRAMQACGLIYHVAREQSFDNQYFFFRVASLPSSFVIADFVAQTTSSAGFEQRDRAYLGTEYPRCFVGKEAIAWCRQHRLSPNEAMSATQRLIDLSIVSHVFNEHPMKDDALFYRFHAA